MSRRRTKFFTTVFLLALVSLVPKEFTFAQEITLELEPSTTLETAEVLNLTTLGINNDGSGPVLVSAFLENTTDEVIDRLFMEIKISASKVGEIVALKSYSTQPFSLEPYQSIYATNNDLANKRIPGIEGEINFSGGLTSEGDNFLSNLSGAMTLPRDEYSIEVIIFRVTDATGRQDLARSVIEFGGGLTSSAFDESEIYLKTPGDIAGGTVEITNPYPQFSWEGSSNVTYRLLVVEDNGQDSPESLLQSAKSSAPPQEGGSLLEFENLDVLVNETSFQYPSSGAQALEPGKRYYWRVLTSLQGSGDVAELSSEIWNFTLSRTSEASDSPPVSEEMERAIMALIGEDEYRRLKSNGFTLTAIEYDGQEFTGPAATLKLEELLRQIRDEEIILGGN